jgi:hypothetical protein
MKYKPIVVVVSLLAIVLAGISVALLFHPIPKESLTDARMWVIKRRILRSARDNARLPENISNLPPLERFDNSVADGWNRAIQYEFDTNGIVTLTSLGADGRPGGDAENRDIVRVFSARSPDGAWVDELSDWIEK